MSQRARAARRRRRALPVRSSALDTLPARLEIVRERRTGQWTHASNTSHDRGPTERDPHTCATSTTQLASERHTHARDDRPDVVRDKVRTPVHRRPPLKVSPGRPIHGVIHRDFRRVCAFDAWPTPHGAWCVRARSVEMSVRDEHERCSLDVRRSQSGHVAGQAGPTASSKALAAARSQTRCTPVARSAPRVTSTRSTSAALKP